MHTSFSGFGKAQIELCAQVFCCSDEGSCKNNRNQTITDAYQPDKVLAETQKQRGICVIHGSRNPLDCSHQVAGIFRSRSRIARVRLNQQSVQRT